MNRVLTNPSQTIQKVTRSSPQFNTDHDSSTELSTFALCVPPERAKFFHAGFMKQNNQHSESNSPNHFQQPALYSVPGHKIQQDASSRMTIDSPEEVLAYIQCTLGFAPQNSLVVVAFAGNHLSTVVRCDLPQAVRQMLRSDTPECVTFLDYGLTESQELQLIDFGRHIGQLMSREPSTTSCMLLYLADDVTIADQQALTVTGTVNSIVTAQFGVQRVRVQEAWLIHHRLLWHLRCVSTTECTVQGEEVGNPEDTDIFRALDPQCVTIQERHTAPRKLVFPPSMLVTRDAVPDTQRLLEQRSHDVLAWLHLWDTTLSTGPQMLHSNQVAVFLESLEHARIREAIQVLSCFDLATAIRGMVTLGRFPLEFLTAADVSLNLQAGATAKGCFRGASERAPDWQRINQLERLCHQLLPLSDGRSGGVVAGILAWIEWLRGRGSIAMTYVQQARKRFPAEQLLITLEEYLSQGLVAEWATRSESAWGPQHAA